MKRFLVRCFVRYSRMDDHCPRMLSRRGWDTQSGDGMAIRLWLRLPGSGIAVGWILGKLAPTVTLFV